MPKDVYNSHYEKLPNGEVRCIDDEIPFEIPDSWMWCRLRNVQYLLTDGTHNRPEYVEQGIPFVSVKDISQGHLDLSNTKYISLSSHKELSKRCNPQKGDLLISKVGTTGVPVIVDTDKPFSLFVSVALMKYFAAYTLPKFLIYLINSPLVQIQVTEHTRGVGNKNWVLNDIYNTLIALPPIAEQQRIVCRIEELVPIVDKYNKSQKELDILNVEISEKLKKSILQEAIRGRLVPQNPNDEPAEALLQRIKKEKERLVAEGKLKRKDLVESTIYRGDDNKYYEQIGGKAIEVDSDFDFPSTWKVVRLADICRLIDGVKKQGKYICLDAKYLRGKSSGDVQNEGKFVVEGDNIILVDGENSGEVFTVPCEGYMGSTFKQLWVSSEMYLPYVLYFIQYYKDRLRNSKKGAAIPHLNKEIFYNLLIGIPPKEEQMRISSKVADLYSNL